jgi:hypothetical protein
VAGINKEPEKLRQDGQQGSREVHDGRSGIERPVKEVGDP